MASLAMTPPKASFDWARFAQTPACVLAVWAIYCAIRLALLPLVGLDPYGPDDYARLLEVRDLMAGQSWFDVTQYRMNPPEGASLHWSRMVDLPIVAGIAFFGLFLSPQAAESAALALVPLLYLLPALFALHSIGRKLGLPPLALGLSLVIMPLFPLLPGNFAPMRIDHHAPQAVAAIICAALLLHAPVRWAALASGVLAAAWIAVSLEGLPLVAVLAGAYGLRYWFAQDRSLGFFLLALAAAAPVFSYLTRPASEFALWCDVLLPGHMLAMGAAAVVSLAIPYAPGQDRAKGRLIALFALPVVAAPVALTTLGSCISDPMAALDPVLKTYWHGMISEGLPVWQQQPSVVMMLLWTMLLVPAGYWLAGRSGLFDNDRGLHWTTLGVFALLANLFSFWLMRGGVVAQLLTIPFGALLLSVALPRARAVASAAPRILATLAALGLTTPVFMSAMFKPLDGVMTQGSLRTAAVSQLAGLPCDYSRLAGLPQGHFFTPLDRGPEILVKTSHTIVMAGYHRNQGPMVDIVKAYIGTPAEAGPIVKSYGADYLLICTSDKDTAVYRAANAGSLTNALANDRVPSWLSPVEGFAEGSLRVYRVQ